MMKMKILIKEKSYARENVCTLIGLRVQNVNKTKPVTSFSVVEHFRCWTSKMAMEKVQKIFFRFTAHFSWWLSDRSVNTKKSILFNDNRDGNMKSIKTLFAWTKSKQKESK